MIGPTVHQTPSPPFCDESSPSLVHLSPARRGPDDAVPLSAWLEPVLGLRLIEIAVDVVLGRGVRLGSPVCAVVRGLLGERLRELRCLTGASACGGCGVASACDYATVFDGAAPHPFWLQGMPAMARLAAGTRYTARLYVAGPAHDIVAYLDVALRDALRAIDPAARVSPSRVRTGTLDQLVSAAPVDGPVRLCADTPLALRGDDAICHALCPHAPWLALLVRAGIRRLDALVRAFAPPPGGRLPRVELPDLTTVEVVRGGLTPWRSSRFSHRQRQRLPLAGLHGEVVIAGDAVTALVPLLRALTVTSVGKATSLGLGALRIHGPAGHGRWASGKV